MPVAAVIGAQWGDEGKGKIVDMLAESADVIARFSGGDNAGHTVVNPLGEFRGWRGYQILGDYIFGILSFCHSHFSFPIKYFEFTGWQDLSAVYFSLPRTYLCR